MGVAAEFRYLRLTWEEMNEAIAAQKVVILPTGSVEQHGPHLPLDVDTFLTESVCLELGRRAADHIIVCPPSPSDSISTTSTSRAQSTSSPRRLWPSA